MQSGLRPTLSGEAEEGCLCPLLPLDSAKEGSPEEKGLTYYHLPEYGEWGTVLCPMLPTRPFPFPLARVLSVT